MKQQYTVYTWDLLVHKVFVNIILGIEGIPELLFTLYSSYGGNFLLNFGPSHDGRIMPIFKELFNKTGTWLNTNGEAIYSTSPWKYQNDTITPNVW